MAQRYHRLPRTAKGPNCQRNCSRNIFLYHLESALAEVGLEKRKMELRYYYLQQVWLHNKSQTET